MCPADPCIITTDGIVRFQWRITFLNALPTVTAVTNNPIALWSRISDLPIPEVRLFLLVACFARTQCSLVLPSRWQASFVSGFNIDLIDPSGTFKMDPTSTVCSSQLVCTRPILLAEPLAFDETSSYDVTFRVSDTLGNQLYTLPVTFGVIDVNSKVWMRVCGAVHYRFLLCALFGQLS
jgi:hypothetical protein